MNIKGSTLLIPTKLCIDIHKTVVFTVGVNFAQHYLTVSW